MDAAREVAVKEANERYKKYRGKTCGNNIVPESIVGREVTVNDAKIVLSTQVLQAKHKPYVAYAFVCWSVRINCPPED